MVTATTVAWPDGDPITDALALVDGTTTTRQGRSVRFTCSTTGTVVVTFFNGNTDTITLSALGDNIYPYSIQSYHVGGAVVTSAATLF